MFTYFKTWSTTSKQRRQCFLNLTCKIQSLNYKHKLYNYYLGIPLLELMKGNVQNLPFSQMELHYSVLCVPIIQSITYKTFSKLDLLLMRNLLNQKFPFPISVHQQYQTSHNINSQNLLGSMSWSICKLSLLTPPFVSILLGYLGLV